MASAILERPEVALHVFVVDFVVGNGGLELGIPVHQALAAVDEALFEQVEESVTHGLRADRVEREALAAPVAADAEALELAGDAGFVFVLPFPDAFHQGVAANVVAGLVLVLEKALFDDCLRGDTRVVRTRNAQRVAARLAAVAYQNVLERIVERMSQMECAGNVRGRNHDRERFAFPAGCKTVFFSPGAMPAGLHIFSVITSFHSAGKDRKIIFCILILAPERVVLRIVSA